MRQRKSNAAVWVLSLLCVVLAALCFWLWSSRPEKEPVAPVALRTLNEGEQKLSDSLGLANRVLSLTEQAFGKSMVLSDTLFVRQDTLHLNGNGIVLNADSTFAGPAVVATANNKVLSLENIIFNGFATAVLLQNSGVQLKNVKFLNCKVAVQRQFFLPSDSALNGAIKDSFIVSRNTTPR